MRVGTLSALLEQLLIKRKNSAQRHPRLHGEPAISLPASIGVCTPSKMSHGPIRYGSTLTTLRCARFENFFVKVQRVFLTAIKIWGWGCLPELPRRCRSIAQCSHSCAGVNENACS